MALGASSVLRKGVCLSVPRKRKPDPDFEPLPAIHVTRTVGWAACCGMFKERYVSSGTRSTAGFRCHLIAAVEQKVRLASRKHELLVLIEMSVAFILGVTGFAIRCSSDGDSI